MNNCLKCNGEAGPGQSICDRCVNNWQGMRAVIQTRLEAIYGEDPAVQPQKLQEFKRLDMLWKRDRELFRGEVTRWFNAANGTNGTNQ